MKSFFSLVNFVVGVVVMLIGLGNILLVSKNPAAGVAGAVVMVVGATFVWLATEAMFRNAKR